MLAKQAYWLSGLNQLAYVCTWFQKTHMMLIFAFLKALQSSNRAVCYIVVGHPPAPQGLFQKCKTWQICYLFV